MVCQRLAPSDRLTTRKWRGTLSSASRDEVMITGRIMMPRVSDPDRIEAPKRKKVTKMPRPNRP